MAQHRVTLDGDVPPGQLRRVEVAGRALCLARTADGGLYAIDDTCSHEEETLSEGQLLGCEVECPWHFGRFDVTTGKAVALPATDPLATYRVAAEDGQLVVEIPEDAEATTGP